MIMTTAAKAWPRFVVGAMSPYPTVVSVTIAQYTLRGMLVNPCSRPSMRYMRDPKITTRVRTVRMKTMIFCLLWRIARINNAASDT